MARILETDTVAQIMEEYNVPNIYAEEFMGAIAEAAEKLVADDTSGVDVTDQPALSGVLQRADEPANWEDEDDGSNVIRIAALFEKILKNG